MKKIYLLAVIAAVMLFGCDTKYYSISINNESTEKTVSFSYNDNNETLAPSESKTYQVEAYTLPPENIVDQNEIASIKMENRQGETFIFTEAEPLTLNVINKLPVDVIIKSDNHIDNNGSPEMLVAKDDEVVSAKIYTKTPNFSADGAYPAVFDWQIENNKMNVVIR